jgi:hypothetical protein
VNLDLAEGFIEVLDVLGVDLEDAGHPHEYVADHLVRMPARENESQRAHTHSQPRKHETASTS